MPAADPSYNPYAKDRTCYTCGRPPDDRFKDGSPLYHCSHPPVQSTAEERARWGPEPTRTYRKVKGD